MLNTYLLWSDEESLCWHGIFPHDDGGGGGGKGLLVFVLGGLYCGEPWREEWYMEGYHFLVFGGLIQGLGLIDL